MLIDDDDDMYGWLETRWEGNHRTWWPRWTNGPPTRSRQPCVNRLPGGIREARRRGDLLDARDRGLDLVEHRYILADESDPVVVSATGSDGPEALPVDYLIVSFLVHATDRLNLAPPVHGAGDSDALAQREVGQA